MMEHGQTLVDSRLHLQLDNFQRQIDRIEDNQERICELLAKKKGSKFNYDGDENVERGNWSGKFDFFLSCLGYAVGLGNVWRFPYLCYKNGGGAFFIPYCIFLFGCGIPVFLFELSVGQFCSEGTTTCWRFAPIFQGLGVGMMVVTVMVSIYYNVIITWGIWYFFDSFRAVLPWTTCGSWSSDMCDGKLKNVTEETCTSDLGLRLGGNGLCYVNATNAIYGIANETLAASNGFKKSTPANDYFNYVGLQVKKSPGFEDLGMPRWDMTLCLLLAWVIVFLSMSKGIKSSGKVVYFTALFPYVVLIILFVNGLLQDGYEEGIKFYITPKLEKLQDATVWKDAAVQIFFSLSVSWGGLMTLSSYNRFHTDVVRDTVIVSIGNCATSVFAGFVIFSYLGAFAKASGVPVDKVVDEGVGLAFIVYPQAVTTLPVPTLWAILFFLMLITLGLDSQFATMETLVTGIEDLFPKLRKRHLWLLLVLCIILFLLGLPMTTPGGPYMVTLIDDYSGGWNIMLIALLECIAVAFVYGGRRFAVDIEAMIGKDAIGFIPWRFFKWIWIVCWTFISPLLLVFVMIFSFVAYSGSTYGDYKFPVWANALGWLMTMAVVLSIFICAIIQVAREEGSIKERIVRLSKPTRRWGPALVRYRKLVKHYYQRRLDIDDFDENPDELPDEPMDGTEEKTVRKMRYVQREKGYDNYGANIDEQTPRRSNSMKTAL